MVILATEFGNFEFYRTFSLPIFPSKVRKIKITRMSKSAGLSKFSKYQKSSGKLK